MSNVIPVSRQRIRPAAAWRQLAILPLLIVIVGCGDGGSGTVVTGKVTYKGDPVNAELIFVDKANKEHKAPVLPDGTYTISNLPVGDYKVAVKAGPVIAAPSTTPPPGGDKLPETIKGGAGALPKTVAPPAKYASPDSGLTYTVKSGKQTKDFMLE